MKEKNQFIILFIILLFLPGLLIISSDGNTAIISNHPFIQNNHIKIEGDLELTASTEISSGSGTLDDPFIIADKIIWITNISGIYISNTTSYLNINNCTLYGGIENNRPSLVIWNSTNISISSSKIYLGDQCIIIENSSNITVNKLIINNSNIGISPINSRNISINTSMFYNNFNGISTSNSEKLTISNCNFENITINGIQINKWCNNHYSG